jgi:hypothetical protein
MLNLPSVCQSVLPLLTVTSGNSMSMASTEGMPPIGWTRNQYVPGDRPVGKSALPHYVYCALTSRAASSVC